MSGFHDGSDLPCLTLMTVPASLASPCRAFLATPIVDHSHVGVFRKAAQFLDVLAARHLPVMGARTDLASRWPRMRRLPRPISRSRWPCRIFVSRRRDVDFGWIFWAFAIFILACGFTHVLSIVTLWVPIYGIEGLVKAATAAASIVTAVMLWPLLPKLLALPSPSQLRAAQVRPGGGGPAAA